MNGRRWTKREIIRYFKEAVASGFVLGNYYIALSTVGDRSWLPFLRKFDERLRRTKQDAYCKRVQRCWIKTLCVWFEGGPAGLAQLCGSKNADELCRGMGLAILNENRSSENIALAATLLPLRFTLPKDPQEFETVAGWCRDLATTFETSRNLHIDEKTKRRLRKFVHALLKKAVVRTLERERESVEASIRQFPLAADIFYFAPGLTVLQYVGDATSCELLKQLPDWSDEVRLRRDKVIDAIQRRLTDSPIRCRIAPKKKSARKSATRR